MVINVCFFLNFAFVQNVSGLRFFDFVSKHAFFMKGAQVFVRPGQESLQTVTCVT